MREGVAGVAGLFTLWRHSHSMAVNQLFGFFPHTPLASSTYSLHATLWPKWMNYLLPGVTLLSNYNVGLLDGIQLNRKVNIFYFAWIIGWRNICLGMHVSSTQGCQDFIWSRLILLCPSYFNYFLVQHSPEKEFLVLFRFYELWLVRKKFNFNVFHVLRFSSCLLSISSSYSRPYMLLYHYYLLYSK